MSEQFPVEDPSWDLDPIFEGGVESESFDREVELLNREVDELQQEVAALELPQEQGQLGRWRQFFDRYFQISDRLREAGSFARALASAHTDEAEAMRMPSRLDDVQTAMRQVRVQLESTFRNIDDAQFALFTDDERFGQMTLWLEELRSDAQRAMDRGREMLAAKLNRDGLHAWGRLYSEVSGRLEVEIERDGQMKTYSVGQAKNLMINADRSVRRAAFEGLQHAWKEASPVCASALHAIRGTQRTLYEERGGDCLTDPLEVNRVERSTIEAMFEAAREFKPVLQRYLKAKARLIGVDRLQWYDLRAPVGEEAKEISYSEAQQFIVDQVEEFSPKMASFCRDALARRWVEAEDRPCKRQGGYCTSFPVSGQIRIFMTFGGTSSGVSTLAHELGHGYHGMVMKKLPASERQMPMGLAETASTLVEALVEQAALRQAGGQRRLALLDQRLERATAFLINIPARFQLEKKMHELRAEGRLHEELLSDVTRQVFERAYGDPVAGVDELFWASKLHFFITGLPFYNFPYTFGYLFSRAVYQRALDDETFRDGLDDLLADTGRMRCEPLAQKYLDADLGSVEFWKEAAGALEEDVQRFEKSVEASL